MKPLLQVSDLSRTYGERTAVDRVSFEVERGSLFAFLGPNGAGKSTTISMLISLLRPSSGTITYHFDGCPEVDAVRDRAVLKERLGVVFQDSLLDPQLTVQANLRSRAKLYSRRDGAFDRVRELLSLDELMSRTYGTLSGGQRRRVDIGRALLNSPEILFLDEPTTGLDPQSRRLVWSAVASLREELGMTVFLTTHSMEEAEGADHVEIIDEGRIVVSGTPQRLRAKYAGHRFSVDERRRLARSLKDLGFSPELIGGRLVTVMDDPKAAVQIIRDHADDISDFEFVHGTMDDVFLATTGKNLREE